MFLYVFRQAEINRYAMEGHYMAQAQAQAALQQQQQHAATSAASGQHQAQLIHRAPLDQHHSAVRDPAPPQPRELRYTMWPLNVFL